MVVGFFCNFSSAKYFFCFQGLSLELQMFGELSAQAVFFPFHPCWLVIPLPETSSITENGYQWSLWRLKRSPSFLSNITINCLQILATLIFKEALRNCLIFCIILQTNLLARLFTAGCTRSCLSHLASFWNHLIPLDSSNQLSLRFSVHFVGFYWSWGLPEREFSRILDSSRSCY